MSYKPYVIYEYHCDAYKGNVIPIDGLNRAPKQVSHHIDSLTYNRIVGRGFSNLTTFQQETTREMICQQADFEYENTGGINTILQNHNTNGVSAQLGSSWNVFTDKGIAMKRDVHALLSQTGLYCRLVG